MKRPVRERIAAQTETVKALDQAIVDLQEERVHAQEVLDMLLAEQRGEIEHPG